VVHTRIDYTIGPAQRLQQEDILTSQIATTSLMILEEVPGENYADFAI